MISIMLYILNINNYLKMVTDEEVKDLVAISFNECFKSTRNQQNL